MSVAGRAGSCDTILTRRAIDLQRESPLFGSFQSSKRPADSAFGQPAVQVVARILVPESALRASQPEQQRLFQAVSDFADAMHDIGLYEPAEIPANSVRAQAINRYMAEVMNGGHHQYIHNCLASTNESSEIVWQSIADGLSAIGADAHLEIFLQMRGWVGANPLESQAQTGFEGGRAEDLDELDRRFHELEQSESLVSKCTAWLALLPELRDVPDDELAPLLQTIIDANPKRQRRLIGERIQRIECMLQDRFQLAMGMAATACQPINAVIAVGGGSSMEVDGNQETAFHILTNEGKRFGVLNANGASLFEMIEYDNPEMPAAGDPEGMLAAMQDGRLSQWRAPEVGERLASELRAQGHEASQA